MNKYIAGVVAAFSLLLLAGCAQTASVSSNQDTSAKNESKNVKTNSQVRSAPAGRRMLAEDFSSSLRKGTTVVYFAKVSCPSCKRQDAIWQKAIKKLPAGAKSDKRFTYAVNYRAYGITQLPTLVFYKDGVEVSRNVGVMAENKILSATKRAM